MDMIWTDSEVYNGRGTASEHQEVSQPFPEIEDEPCLQCEFRDTCEMACKAFRNYVATGKFKENDIGRLMREFA